MAYASTGREIGDYMVPFANDLAVSLYFPKATESGEVFIGSTTFSAFKGKYETGISPNTNLLNVDNMITMSKS